MSRHKNDHFSDFLDGVKPLEQDKVVLSTSKDERDGLKQRIFQQLDQKADPNYLATDHIDWIDIYQPLEYKKDGLQEGVYRKLRLGKYPIESRLDLHKITNEQARHQVFQFIQDCLQAEIRSILINHGVGLKSKPPGRLKSFINTWLGQIPEVLAYHSAQKQHGGLAATYVLLKKSDRKRLENRERFNR